VIVSQKRVYGTMKAADLLVRPNPKLRAKRNADTRKPRPTRPNQCWGIDMTKVMIEGCGWVYLVVVLDWHSRKVVGHDAGLQARAWHWLVALNRAVNRQFPGGIEGQNLNLMADNGCQPTSLAVMRVCAAIGVRQAFTSYSNPKGNAEIERFLRTLKEELVWLREWTSPAACFAALDRWLADANATYLHSALGYRAPDAVEAEHLTPLPYRPLAKLNGGQYTPSRRRSAGARPDDPTCHHGRGGHAAARGRAPARGAPDQARARLARGKGRGHRQPRRPRPRLDAREETAEQPPRPATPFEISRPTRPALEEF
jgi:transposase InsO family protein